MRLRGPSTPFFPLCKYRLGPVCDRMHSNLTSSRTSVFGIETAGRDVVAGLISSSVAIPLAMAFGMFAFVTLGDEYFAYGAMAGLVSAVTAGSVCVLLGDRSTRVYAPRITTTFFLGLLLYALLQRDTTVDTEPHVAATLLVFFAIILLGGLLQALFGLVRLGSLIKFAPHPVMAGFQNMAAVLLFLVQLGNVLGFEHNVRFARVFAIIGEGRPWSVLVAALTFVTMWNARRITTKIPPLLVGLGCGIIGYYALVLMGFGGHLGPTIGPKTASAAMRTVLIDFQGLPMAATLESSFSVMLPSALALAIIASIDALLCAKLTSQPGELRAGDDQLWTKQLVTRLIKPGTPQRGAIALDLGVSVFVSLLSIAINVVLAVFIGIVLAVLLFVVRMSRSNIRGIYRCDAVRSRRYRDPAELEVLHREGASVLVIELQGALFFGSAERLAQIVERETAQGTGALL